MAFSSGAKKDDKSLTVLDKNVQQDDKPCRVSSMGLARSKFRELHYIILPLGYLLLEKGRMEFTGAQWST